MSELKEPHHFSDLGPLSAGRLKIYNVVRDPAKYEALFAAGVSQPFVGEGSTSYLTDLLAPERIMTASPEASIVAVLRDPAERAYSHYLNDVREGFEKRTFGDAIRAEIERPAEQQWPAWYVRYGFYGRAIHRWIDCFGKARVLVIFFEEMLAHPAKALETIQEFLGLGIPFVNSDYLIQTNSYSRSRFAFVNEALGSASFRLLTRRVIPKQLRSTGRRILFSSGQRPEIPLDEKSLLWDIYYSDVASLEKTLGRLLPWTDFYDRSRRSLAEPVAPRGPEHDAKQAPQQGSTQ